MVKAAIGETIDNETLGGSVSQTDLSGVIDDRFPDDQSCLDRIRFLVDKIGDQNKAGFNRKGPVLPKYKSTDIFGILPSKRSKPYKSIDLIKRLVDNSEFDVLD